ncbi:MAG TPA: type I-U CRISPR-associated protein Csx17 [Verrucomicrobiae bacterium]|nr:type I-U CRISPR-associated protein Csx17 [Verrucomicrobiae bacterium]
MSTHTILFPGCTPTPLAAYLKALGLFRILSQQRRDSAPRAYWQGNTFVLSSTFDRDQLRDFLLHHYAPSPLVAPWNGGSGFYPKDNTVAIKAIEASTAPRLAVYRETVSASRAAIAALDLKEKPDAERKERLLLRCRNTFSEAALEWLDSAFVLTGDGAKYPPLLGTGGNDGRLEFTNNFMQRLTELFDLADPEAPGTPSAIALLGHALFDTPTRGLADKPIGQFSPAVGGGANASTGFDAKSTLNSWDFVLALEGALLFAAATIKRLEGTAPGQLVYPFCVQPSGSGYGSSAAADEDGSRCEIWMPLWSAPMQLPELQTLLAEGRAWVGRRPAKSGVDFARAVASLGVDRGIREFQRYGFHVRNGLAYFATPLQRLRVHRDHVTADLLAACDGWIQRFLPKAQSSNAPGSIARAGRRLEAAIFAQCASAQSEHRPTTQELLASLGDCERALATSAKWTTENYIPPIPPLSPEWIAAAATDDMEFRLAASIASLGLWVNKQFFPLRRHLEAVKVGFGTTPWAAWDEEAATEVISSENSVMSLLLGMMQRRLLLAQKLGGGQWPEYSRITAWPCDIADFIEGRIDDERFIRLLWGLCLVAFPPDDRSKDPHLPPPKSDAVPPAFYGQLKLCFAARLPESREVPLTPTIFNLAASGDGARASEQALRRLHGSSIPITHVQIAVSGKAAERTAAALLFPLWDSQLQKVCIPIAPLLFRQPIAV